MPVSSIHMLIFSPSYLSLVLLLLSLLLCVIGEGLLQGGWIIFDRDGLPRAAFQEDAKQRVPIDKIVDEVKKISVSK